MKLVGWLGKNQLGRSFAILVGCVVFWVGEVLAESFPANTPWLRIRFGSGGAVDTVIYNAGIPTSMNGLAGQTGTPTISTNTISGGSGAFRVRIVTDVDGIGPIYQGRYFYNSSTPLACTTLTTCGGVTIDFSKISWIARDGDVHNTVFRYDGMNNLETHTQTDNNILNGGLRDRNYFRFSYDNDVLLPAGTYEEAVQLEGNATISP